MRLLKETEGSVLWLVRDNDAATRNLCAAAQASGLPPGRLVFAERGRKTSTSPAIARPIYSWIPPPTMRTRPRATHTGPGCLS
jgi:hypothetical protein